MDTEKWEEEEEPVCKHHIAVREGLLVLLLKYNEETPSVLE